MSKHTANGRLKSVVKLLEVQALYSASDQELLNRFVATQDDAAFRVIAERHGPMVLGVCQRALGCPHDAEDAFQATFLVFARSARKIRKSQALASWLHGVAGRVSSKLVRDRTRRLRREQDRAPRASNPVDDLTWAEVRAGLDEELQRLPENYRNVLVLCYLEGKTRDEAAQQLDLTLGVLHGRLERGRKLLAERLSARGLALSVGLLAVTVTPSTVSATVRAAALLAASESVSGVVSPCVLALTNEVLKGVTMSPIKANCVGLLGSLILLAGIGYGASQLPAESNGKGKGAQEGQVQSNDLHPAGDVKRAGVRKGAVDRFGDPLPPGALARLGTVRFRHGGSIFSVAYSPDGKTLVTGSGDGDCTLRLWDSESGRELLRIEHAKGQIYSVAFSANGKMVALGGDGSFVSVCDAATGKELHRFFHEPEEPIYTVAFSPDGKTVAAGGREYSVRLWDLVSGKERGRLIGHRSIIWGFAYSPDGRLLATACDDRTVKIWDPQTCKELRQLPPFPREANQVAFSRDSTKLVTGCRDGSIAVWDPATGKELLQVKAKNPKADFKNCLAFSRDGKAVISGGLGVLFDADSGAEKARLDQHESWVRTLSLSPDGKKLAFEDYTCIRFWDSATGKILAEDEGHHGGIASIAFFPDGRTLASGASDGTVRLWEAATGKPLRTMQVHSHSGERFCYVAVSSDGKTLAARTGGMLYGWEVATGKEILKVHHGDDSVRSLAFAPDGKTLATGSGLRDKAIRLWDVQSGKELRCFIDQEGGISSLVFSADGRLMASGGGDTRVGTICVWETASGKKLKTITVGDPKAEHVSYFLKRVNGVAFSPEGTLLASVSGGFDPMLRLWNVATGDLLLAVKTENDCLQSVAFSRDGQMIASVGDRGNVELWEVATGRRRRVWAAHPGLCNTLAFAPDGRRLATGGCDTTIVIWDVKASPESADKPLARDDLDRLWADLVSDNATKAYDAICAFAANPVPSVAYLKKRLPPCPKVDNERVRTLIADLASHQFAVRQAAHQELKGLGEQIVDALHRKLGEKPELEFKRRLESLLVEASVLRSDKLRRIRAIQALEDIASEDARQALRALADGPSTARVSQHARAALRRLKD